MAKLAEYFFNGNGNDASGNGNDLTVNLASGAAAWDSDAAGGMLDMIAAAQTSAASARVSLAAGDLGGDLEGATTFTVIVKTADLQLGAYPDSPVMHIGESGQPPDLQFVVGDSGAGGALFFLCLGAEVGFWDRESTMVAIVVDTTQATAGNRIRTYRRNPAGENEFIASPPFFTAPAQNVALSGVNDANTFLTFLNNVDTNNNAQGAIKYARIESGALTQTQIFDAFDNLDEDDDADPMAPPTLAFVSAPAITSGTITSSGAQIQLTTNLAADVRVIDTATTVGTPPPSEYFDLVESRGTTTGHSVFTFALPGQAPSTTRRWWIKVDDGTTELFPYVDVTTTAVTNNIISINGNNPIRYGQATIDITWDQVPETLDPVSINGVSQTGHTGINSTTSRFGPLVWPNRMYGQTATLTTGSKSATTPQILPAVGYSYVTLSGYTEDPPATPDVATILGDPAAVAVDGNQFVFNSESGEISMDSQGRFSFGSGFDGTVTIAIVDSADGVHSDFVTLYYGGAADLIPTIPAFSNLTNQEPGVAIVDSFVVAGVDAGYDITFAAVGSMLVATSNSGPWLPSVTRQLGETVWRRMITGALGQTVTGGVSSGGQSSTCTYTTRAANAPVITTQPQNQTVTVNAPATFNIAGTNIGSRQWRVNGVNVSGATGATFVHTPTAVGTYTITCVVQSPEGVSVTSDPATLTVIAVANRVLIPELRHRITGLLLGGTQNLPCYVLSDDRSQVLVPGTTINLAASGTTPLVNNSLGAVGTYVRVGFPDADGTSVEVRLQVEA